MTEKTEHPVIAALWQGHAARTELGLHGGDIEKAILLVEKLLAIKRAAKELEVFEGWIDSVREAGWIVPNEFENLFAAVRAYWEKK